MITTGKLVPSEEFLEIFKKSRNVLDESSVNIINVQRDEAISHFKELGIPSNKNEDYKYSDIRKLFDKTLKKQFLPKRIDFDVNQIFKCDIPTLDTNVILLVNGYYYEKQPYLQEFDNGVIAGSFAAAASRYPELVEQHYGKYADHGKEGLVALNTAFAQDGFFLYIPNNTVQQKPFQVINLLMSNESIMVQHRNLIVMGENSQAEIIICDHSLSPHDFLTNEVSEIYTGKNANLHVTRMQNEHNQSSHLSYSYTHQEKDSNVMMNIISLHGGYIRNNFYATLAGEGANHDVQGLYLTDMTQHLDNFVLIDHASPHCTSNQLFKGILDDKSTASFTGKIMVRRNAQKTNAFQTNRNILLTDEAKASTKPQLEIYADDVKCSHGATVGQLDKDALFYLRSRGISFEEAQFLLLEAFTREIFSNLRQPALKERVEELVSKRLKRELTRCNNCVMHCC